MKIRRLIAAGMGAVMFTAMAAFPSLAAEWKQDGSSWWYEREDKSYPAGAWEQIDGKWYMFGRDGYMLTGWQMDKGVWYYLGADGAMASGTSLTIDGVPYTFGPDGAMAEQTAAVPLMGRWEGTTFINDWSDIRLTVPPGFITMDSAFLSRLVSDSSAEGAVADMAAMKDGTCGIIVLYAPDTNGNTTHDAVSFLNMFLGGTHTMEGGGRMETVQIGSLSYLRCYFPPTESEPVSGYIYMRSMGNYYSIILALSDADDAAYVDAALATLATAH